MQVVPGGENKASVPRSRKERGPSPVAEENAATKVLSTSAAAAEEPLRSSSILDDWRWCIGLFCIGYGSIGAARTAFASVIPEPVF